MNQDAKRRSALLITTLSSFLTPFMTSSVTIALPQIAKTFQMDAVLVSWVATSYALTGTIFLVPFGRIADIYGRRKVFQYGMLLFTLSSISLIFSTSPTFLIIMRLLQGFGSCMTYSTAVAILTSAFPSGERGKVMGINVAAVYSGLSFGPFVGGFFTEHFGWRSVFVAAIPLCLVILYYSFWKLKEEWTEFKGEIDLRGSIIYTVALAALMYGFTLLPSIPGVGLILAGFLGILMFVQWVSKAKSPVLDVNLFRKSRIFALSNLAALIHYSATFAVTFLLSLYLQYIKGLGPQSAGLILICQPIIQAIVSPIAGRLSDRIQARVVASTGMFLTAVGIFPLSFLEEKTAISYIVMSLVILGFGFSLFSSPNANSVMSSVERESYGIASAVLSTMRQMGQMLSMGMVTVIFSTYIGRVQIAPQHYGLFLKSSKTVFLISVVLCLAGMVASFSRGKAVVWSRESLPLDSPEQR